MDQNGRENCKHRTSGGIADRWILSAGDLQNSSPFSLDTHREWAMAAGSRFIRHFDPVPFSLSSLQE
jgi:hypothetical protein